MKRVVTAAGIAAFTLTAVAFAAQDEPQFAQPAPERFGHVQAAVPQAPSGEAGASLNLCGERAQMVRDLGQRFQERPLASGLVDENAVMEIFVSSAGTWTILATGTDGLSCVMAVGEGFDAAPPQIMGVGA